MTAIRGHFDGMVIVPDEPIDLPRNTNLIIHIESAGPRGTDGASLLRFAGTIDAKDLEMMSKAIETGCEKVDDEW
jgi:hypothetical protein